MYTTYMCSFYSYCVLVIWLVGNIARLKWTDNKKCKFTTLVGKKGYLIVSLRHFISVLSASRIYQHVNVGLFIFIGMDIDIHLVYRPTHLFAFHFGWTENIWCGHCIIMHFNILIKFLIKFIVIAVVWSFRNREGVRLVFFNENFCSENNILGYLEKLE